MYTLEKAITEYLRLSRLSFCKNNPNVPVVFSAAAVALASRMWIDGSDEWPGTFYIALIGDPGTGKTTFVEKFLLLFHRTGVRGVSAGSPEAMVMDLDEARHAYIFFDELSRLSRNMDGYMAPLLPNLNIAYYLGEIGQRRTDKKRSVVIPAGEYFLHVYFTGLKEDWATIERKAPGGFVRRTLVIPVAGEIPFFKRDHKDPHLKNYISQLRVRIRHILKLLTKLDLEVVLPDFPHLGEELSKASLDPEKKIMVHEYTQKILAGRIIANLITFDIGEDFSQLDLNELLHRMEENGKKMNIDVKVVESTQEFAVVRVYVPEVGDSGESDQKDMSLDGFLPPHYEVATFKQLMEAVKPRLSAPDQITLKNIERIENWLKGGGDVVISIRKFGREILHTGNPTYYQAVLDVLERTGYIRIVDYVYKGRQAQYVVLDPTARICGNCAHYRDPKECPLIKDIFDFKEAATKVPPWEKACEKFEEVVE